MTDIVKKKINKEKLGFILDKIFHMAKENFIDRDIVSGVVIDIFKEYLEEKNIRLSTESSLYENPAVSEKIDIADIKLENDVVIDIRTIVGEDYPQMCVPREHFRLGIQPDIYLGIKIDRFLEEVEIIGFIKTDDITQLKGNDQYFIVNFEELSSINDIENAIYSIDKKQKKYFAADHEKAASLFIPFIDKIISENDRSYLLEHILNCPECKKQFNEISNLDYVLKNEKEKFLLDTDYSLRLLMGDPVLAGNKEIEILIDEDEEEEPDKEQELLVEQEESIEAQEILTEGLIPEEETIQENDLRDLLNFGETITEENPLSEELVSGDEIENIAIEQEIQTEDIETEIISFEELALNEKALPEENITSEPEIIEEKVVEIKKTTPRDWAEALANNASQEKTKEPEFFIEEDLSQQDLRKQEVEEQLLDENILDEKNLSGKLTDNFIIEEKNFNKYGKIQEENPEKNPEENPEKIPEKIDLPKEENSDIETLDDVETLQGEDDINSILSFFDGRMDTSIESAKESDGIKENNIIKVEKEERKAKIAPSVEKKYRGDLKVRKGDNLGYTSVIEAGDSSDDDEDFFAQEDMPAIEVIRQEELLDIFGTDVPGYKISKATSKKHAKSFLKDAITDKSVVTFTIAITLSTTVLFLSLGQINKQVKISNNSTSISESLEPQDSELPPIKIKKERVPLKTYSREIIKVVKPEKKTKAKQVNNFMDNFADGFTPSRKAVSLEPEIKVKNISWELPAEIALDTQMKDYFIQIGQQFKDKLSENLNGSGLDAEDSTINLYTELNNKGEIVAIKIAESSGDGKIDKMCINTLKEIIGRYKLSSSVNRDKIKFLLLIRT